MRSIEREFGLAVIKGSRAPIRNGMACRAFFVLASAHELSAVNVFMALMT